MEREDGIIEALLDVKECRRGSIVFGEGSRKSFVKGGKVDNIGTNEYTPPKRSLGETKRSIARRVRHPAGCESKHTERIRRHGEERGRPLPAPRVEQASCLLVLDGEWKEFHKICDHLVLICG